MSMQPGKHWVEDLFPPKFGYTFDEILKDPTLKVRTEQDEIAEDKDKPPSVYAQVARRVSPLDVSAIKNVYERVWLMSRMKEEAKQEQSLSEESLNRSVTLIGHQKVKVKSRDVGTSTSDINKHAPLDIHNPCIWSSTEIEVLRSVFQTAKEQNTKLRAQLQETQNQAETLEINYKKQQKTLETRTKKLKEAFKANERLEIMCKNLKRQVDDTEGKIEELCEQIKEMKKERSKMLGEMHELRVIGDRDRLDRKKAELELQCHTRETIRQERIKQANVKAMYDEDVQFLQTTVEELTQELNKEKVDHERTKRALEHLRRHFSAQGSTQPEQMGSVLKDWSY